MCVYLHVCVQVFVYVHGHGQSHVCMCMGLRNIMCMCVYLMSLPSSPRTEQVNRGVLLWSGAQCGAWQQEPGTVRDCVLTLSGVRVLWAPSNWGHYIFFQ